MIAIGFSQGISTVSSLIKWYQFGNPNTHVFAVLNSDFEKPIVCEAWHMPLPRGNVYYSIPLGSNHTPGTKYEIYSIKSTEKQEVKFFEFLQQQANKPYDLVGLLNFFTRTRKKPDQKWFCSELVFSALQYAGINILLNTDAYATTPALMLKSTMLKKVYNGSI